MKLIIEGAVVYKNIKLFKQILQKHLHDTSRHFNAFINRKTGEILFEEEMGAVDQLNLKHFKPICLSFRPFGQKNATPGFEILEEESNETLFECKDLSPIACRILAQMIEALNRVVFQAPHRENTEEIFREVVETQLESPLPKHFEKDVMRVAWHNVSRIDAERLLAHQAAGTYLFRKDEYASLLEEQLSSRWREPIKCITLSYVESHAKVRDLTLVGKGGQWYLYDNDPSLEETAYSDLTTLLKSLHESLSEPLLLEEAG